MMELILNYNELLYTKLQSAETENVTPLSRVIKEGLEEVVTFKQSAEREASAALAPRFRSSAHVLSLPPTTVSSCVRTVPASSLPRTQQCGPQALSSGAAAPSRPSRATQGQHLRVASPPRSRHLMRPAGVGAPGTRTRSGLAQL